MYPFWEQLMQLSQYIVLNVGPTKMRRALQTPSRGTRSNPPLAESRPDLKAKGLEVAPANPPVGRYGGPMGLLRDRRGPHPLGEI